MAEYNPSKIIKDGNTYNFRDTTKIPLAGSNEISGSLIPSTDGTIDLGSPSYQWNNLYTKNYYYNGVAWGLDKQNEWTNFQRMTSNPAVWYLRNNTVTLGSAPSSNRYIGIFFEDVNGADLGCAAFQANRNSYNSIMFSLHNSDGTNTYTGALRYRASTTGAYSFFSEANECDLGIPTNKWKAVYSNAYYLGSTAFGDIVTYNAAEFVPRSGGAVMTGSTLSRTVDDSELRLEAGSGWNKGGAILMFGKDNPSVPGQVQFRPSNGTDARSMFLQPNGTWTWNGTACQITSDQRLKQQIVEIDDKLLDAWEDVNLVQFKYNDAVDQKKDKARLHTGYVVQQIDEACKSHGVDVSTYGLFCHEEYPQETEEVEVEQKDGTKTKEKKVIREASEHYSLRYTEVYAVECMYLRRCIKQLTARIEQLEKGNK